MNRLQFEIGGKVRGFKIGLGFLGDLLNHYETDMMGLGAMMVRNPFSATPAILFYAHKHDCINNGDVIDFKINDIEDWIEDLPDMLRNENIESLLMLLMDSVKKHLPSEKGEDSKKK